MQEPEEPEDEYADTQVQSSEPVQEEDYEQFLENTPASGAGKQAKAIYDYQAGTCIIMPQTRFDEDYVFYGAKCVCKIN